VEGPDGADLVTRDHDDALPTSSLNQLPALGSSQASPANSHSRCRSPDLGIEDRRVVVERLGQAEPLAMCSKQLVNFAGRLSSRHR